MRRRLYQAQKTPVKVASKAKKSSAGKRVLELSKRLSSGYKDAEIRSNIGKGDTCTSKDIKAAIMKAQGMFSKSDPDLSRSDSETEVESM